MSRIVYIDCNAEGEPHSDDEGCIYGSFSATWPDGVYVRAYVPAADLDAANARIGELEAEVKRVRGLIDRDRTGLAMGLNDVLLAVRAHSWLESDEWGNYRYDERTEETLRKEIRFCFEDVRNVATEALRRSGALADSAFHPEEANQPRLPTDDDRAVLNARSEVPEWCHDFMARIARAWDDDIVDEAAEVVHQYADQLRACGIEPTT